MAKMSRSKRLLTALLYLLFLMPSAYSLAAVTELVLLMGHGSGIYSDYGRSSSQVALAIGFMLFYLIWIVFGTTAAALVFSGQWRLWWLGVLGAISLLVMMPTALVFLLGAGHS